MYDMTTGASDPFCTTESAQLLISPAAPHRTNTKVNKCFHLIRTDVYFLAPPSPLTGGEYQSHPTRPAISSQLLQASHQLLHCQPERSCRFAQVMLPSQQGPPVAVRYVLHADALRQMLSSVYAHSLQYKRTSPAGGGCGYTLQTVLVRATSS